MPAPERRKEGRPLEGSPTGNRLLDALSEEELERLSPSLEVVSLGIRETIIESDEPVPYVHFPVDCVISLIVAMDDGQIIEVGTIGNEGMSGLPVFLGRDTIPLGSFCQIPGEAVRVSSEDLRTEVEPGSELHRLLQRYTEATFVFAAQSSACNRLHSIGQRAARWLLHTHDRVGRDGFPLTQEFLAQMLGVRRAGVSEVAGELQREGLISYSRGKVMVLDRSGLEERSCECYRIIVKEFDRLP